MANECDCEDIALLEMWCDFVRLVGRWERRLVDVGMDSGMGSDIFCEGLWCLWVVGRGVIW